MQTMSNTVSCMKSRSDGNSLANSFIDLTEQLEPVSMQPRPSVSQSKLVFLKAN